MAIRCGSCKETHPTVQEVRECHSGGFLGLGSKEHRQPTQKQLDYAHSLLRTREIPPGSVVADLEQQAAHEAVNAMSFDQIRDFISSMVNQPKREVQEHTAPATVGEGMYMINETVFKVQRAVHGSGHLYVKILTDTGFEVAPGMLGRLRPENRMTLEQAKEYGRLYGTCCRCGRTLTDEGSIEAGIGPVCAGKEGWA